MIDLQVPDLEWFDSPEYQLLYKHRGNDEAALFINHLLKKVYLEKGARVLDLACGRGRHSLIMNSKGYEVTGLDAGENNINIAKKSSTDGLEFYVHDIRKFFMINYFDLSLCLFTSFGYYFTDHENAKIIRTASLAIKPNGYFVLDFLNKQKILENLVSEERKNVNGIDFIIKRYINRSFLIKEIIFRKNNTVKTCYESIKLFEKNELIKIFTENNLKNIEIYGDYKLNPFNESNSDRLILIARKNA